jgi:hypothetical protein
MQKALTIGPYDSTGYKPRQVRKEATVRSKGLVMGKPGPSLFLLLFLKALAKRVHDRIWALITGNWLAEYRK